MHSLAFLHSPNLFCHPAHIRHKLHTIIKLSNAKRCTQLLSKFSSKNSLYFGVNEIISFQKLIGNLDKMTTTNLDRQHHRSLDSYFKSSS